MKELLLSVPAWVWTVIILWELIWKITATWHASCKDHLKWYIALLLVNSFGILPIVYLTINYRKDKQY